MGCTSPLVVRDGVMVCDCTFSSFLVDGVSPNIDTSDNDWAAQLVTVRRNEGTADITFSHVLLTFAFDTAVSPTLLALMCIAMWTITSPFVLLVGMFIILIFHPK